MIRKRPTLEDYDRIGIKMRALSALFADTYCDVARTIGKKFVRRTITDSILWMQNKIDDQLYSDYCDSVYEDNDEFRWNCVFGPMWDNDHEREVVFKAIFKSAREGERTLKGKHNG